MLYADFKFRHAFYNVVYCDKFRSFHKIVHPLGLFPRRTTSKLLVSCAGRDSELLIDFPDWDFVPLLPRLGIDPLHNIKFKKLIRSYN